MNVTLIQPFTDNLEPPLSLAFLAGVLRREGHRVRIIDLQVPDVRKEWEEVFTSEPSDLVGITSMTPQIRQAHEIAEQVKELLPRVPVIVGGTHPTLLPTQTLEEFPAFDLAAIGEGEETIVELASRLAEARPIFDDSVSGIAYRSEGRTVVTEPRARIRDLNDLPNPHEHYDFDFYLNNNSFGFTDRSASVIVSRGCPYSCRFCATKSFWTRRYVCKSVDAVIEEIRYLIGRGAKGIVFRDSTFNINRRWLVEFCRRIHQEKLRFKWAINARVNLVDYESFSEMKRAGLDTVYFGVESGSQKMLDFYGKGITLQQTENAFKICKKLKLRTGAYYMLGALPETREDMEMTYRFAKKLGASFSLVFIFMPLPGSELYQYYMDQGYRFEYSNVRSDKVAISHPDFTPEELEAIRKRWYHEFNRKPNLLVRGLHSVMAVRSWNDFRWIWGKVAARLT